MFEYATAYVWVRLNWRKPLNTANWIKGSELIKNYPNTQIKPNSYYCHISETYGITDYTVKKLMKILDIEAAKYKKFWNYEDLYTKYWWNIECEEDDI